MARASTRNVIVLRRLPKLLSHEFTLVLKISARYAATNLLILRLGCVELSPQVGEPPSLVSILTTWFTAYSRYKLDAEDSPLKVLNYVKMNLESNFAGYFGALRTKPFCVFSACTCLGLKPHIAWPRDVVCLTGSFLDISSCMKPFACQLSCYAFFTRIGIAEEIRH